MQENPQLVPLLKDAWEARSFSAIRNLGMYDELYMHQHLHAELVNRIASAVA